MRRLTDAVHAAGRVYKHTVIIISMVKLLFWARVRTPMCAVTGLFVPLHFRSRERKDHRENFRSRGTFVPWNIRSRGAKSPRTFVPWNFRSCGTFALQERMF